jgi:hypothetical protein
MRDSVEPGQQERDEAHKENGTGVRSGGLATEQGRQEGQDEKHRRDVQYGRQDEEDHPADVPTVGRSILAILNFHRVRLGVPNDRGPERRGGLRSSEPAITPGRAALMTFSHPSLALCQRGTRIASALKRHSHPCCFRAPSAGGIDAWEE